MASTLFTYSPSTGNGNTNVNVTPSGANTTYADYVSTLTFDNGTDTKSVTLRQKYRPAVLQNSLTIPATGGSITITAATEYDIVFRSVPEWIAITLNGTAIAAGERISSGTASGAVFTLSAPANTGSSRSVGSTFNMGHYIDNDLQQNVSYISVSQPGGAPAPANDINVTVKYAGTAPTGSWQFTVTLISYNGATATTAFTLNRLNTEDDADIPITLNPTGITNITAEVTVHKSSSLPIGTALADMTYEYGEDTETDPALNMDDPSYFYTTYQAGENMVISAAITVSS